MFANVVIEWFKDGGPSCGRSSSRPSWRSVWWASGPSGGSVQSMRRDPATLEKVLASLENGDFPTASRQSTDSEDPVIRMIWHGLNHVHYSLQGALQVAAGVELRKAGRFLTVMDTLVTLAPLLGLLGTVTGIMGSFLVHRRRRTGGREGHRRHRRGPDRHRLRVWASPSSPSSPTTTSRARSPSSSSSSRPPPPTSRSW